MFGMGKKSPADKMVKLFTRKLDAEGLKYNVRDDKPIVSLNYTGDNFKSLTFTFIFDDDGESVAIRVWSIIELEDYQLAEAYAFCNQMNYDYRWLRFYIDDDKELTAAMDAVINPMTADTECLELLNRTVSIVDKVYGKLHS